MTAALPDAGRGRPPVTSRLWSFTICCIFLLLLPASIVPAQVILSEVMFDPSGSEFYDEYIEIQNLGNTPVDLQGWRVGDADETDVLLPLQGTMYLAPGAFGLVLDSGYTDHSDRYDPLPDGLLLLTVDNATLGKGGLSNSDPESVLLISADGDTVGRMVYSVGNTSGRSEEKVNPSSGDGADNWLDARWDGGTPGRVNSVSVKEVDLAVASSSDTPIPLRPGDTGGIPIHVSNLGRSEIPTYTLAVSGEGQDPWIVERPGPEPGKADTVRFTPASLRPGLWRLEVRGRAAGDQDPTNDAAVLMVMYGARWGHVVVSEVMFAPAEGSVEWVEVRNLSGEAVNTTGWHIQDATTGPGGLVSAPGLDVAPLGYSILTSDVAAFRQAYPAVECPVAAPDRWPRLNDGGDLVILRDGTGATVDSAAYPEPIARYPGRSFERIDPAASGHDAANWLRCTDPAGATPGATNSVSVPDDAALSVGVALSATPNPFRERMEIRFSLPVKRAHVNLWVFDRSGRRVASLLEGEPGGSSRRVVWDGTGSSGAPLKPGLYILILEARLADGRTLRARETVVMARGL
jgi:hypothetical protein